MSQKTQHIEEEFFVTLRLKVTLKSFGNHNGFKPGQTEYAAEEFENEIIKELEGKILGKYEQQEFLESVDFVTYEVSLEK